MAEMNMNPREKARLEEEKKNRKTRNKFILVGVIVVLMIALVIFVNSRLFYNVTTALTIGDTNYSVARMNYEYQKAYMNFNQTYGQYFGSLIDTSKSLKEQSCPFDANGGTWDDYFKQSAETNLTQLSAVYAKAIAEGYALTEDEAAEIDTAVESYRTYGKSIGFATLNKFLSAYFGTGNSEKTIRANMAEELIASRYADDVYASFTYTDDEIDAYYAENADSYDRVNVLYTLISAAANEDEGIDADTAKTAAEDKAKVILRLQAGGNGVVMVGDGINDAPALAYADVGISMGSKSTDIAMETSDVIINRDDPMMIPALRRLSRATMRIVHQNFALVIAINSVGLILGAASGISVMMSALLHNSSTILVVANSLRLMFMKPGDGRA
mgnify:CR=1 FL=1